MVDVVRDEDDVGRVQPGQFLGEANSPMSAAGRGRVERLRDGVQVLGLQSRVVETPATGSGSAHAENGAERLPCLRRLKHSFKHAHGGGSVPFGG
ncbi:hypothetical protein ACWEP4_34965 [Streptomyces sp. NPDC004227]